MRIATREGGPLVWGILLFCLGQRVDAQATDPAEDAPSVYLDVSSDARNRITMVDAFVREGQWQEAVEQLQNLIETQGDKIIPVGPESPNSFASLRDFCQRKLSTLPPEALRLYRDRIDSQAFDLFQRSRETGDLTLLRRVADDFFCSSHADMALERLGDRALSSGQAWEAIRWWSKTLPSELVESPEAGNKGRGRLRYPDPKVDLARVGAKWVVAQLVAGNTADAERGIDWLRRRHADAEGVIGGQKGPYWRILDSLRRDQVAFLPPIATTDWLTFGGNAVRNKSAPRQLDAGAIQWKWSFAEETRASERGEPDIRFRSDDELAYFPVVRDKTAILVDENTLWLFDLTNGRADHWDFDDDPINRPMSGARSRFTLSATGDRVLVRTGGIIPGSPRLGQFQRNRFSSSSKLHCLDFRTQKVVWTTSTQALGDQNLVFEGAPVVSEDRVYIAATRLDAMSETSVVCYDLTSGRMLWRTLVCESTNDLDTGLAPMHNLLTLADDTIYYCTNLGAVAALRTDRGSIRWVATYSRGQRTLGGGPFAPRPDLNPCIVDQGRVFVAAADSSRIQCFDAETGTRLWEAHPSVTHMLGVAKGNLIVTSNRVTGIDVKSGKVKWHWPENPVPQAYGRGVLVDDCIYWPTINEIHVLDQETGRKAFPSIPIFDRLHERAGNLIPAAEHLLVVQAGRMLAICRHGRLIDQLRDEVASDPNSPDLRYRLGEAGYSGDNFALAIEQFGEAYRLASANQVIEGKNFKEWAARRRYQARVALAERLVADRHWQDAEAQFASATREAPSTVDKVQVIQRWARIRRETDRPKEAIELYQSVLDDLRTRQEPLAVATAPAVPAGVWAADQIGELILRHGREVYADVDAQARSLSGSATDADQLLAMADRFPNASHHSEILLSAAERFQQAGRLRDAHIAFKRVVRGESTPETMQVRALAGLADCYRQQGLERPFRIALDRLRVVHGHRPAPDGNPQRTVREWLLMRFPIEAVPSEPITAVGFCQRRWTNDEPGSLWIPRGVAPSPAHRLILRHNAGKLQCLRADDGAELWSCEQVRPPLWTAYQPTGILVATPERLACHGYESGSNVWEFRLPDSGANLRAGAAMVLTSTPQEPGIEDGGRGPLAFQLAGDLVLIRRGSSRLLAVDADQGTLVWEQRWNEEELLGPIELAGSACGVWSSQNLFVIEMLTGRRRFAVPIASNVAGCSPVFQADRLIVVSRRGTVASLAANDGKLLWERSFGVPTFSNPLLFADASALAVVLDGYRLARLDPATGSTTWEVPLADRPIHRPIDSLGLWSGRFHDVRDGWITCRSMNDGQVAWRGALTPGEKNWRIAGVGDATVAFGVGPKGGRWIALDDVSGRVRQAMNFPGPMVDDAAAWASDVALVAGKQRHWLLSFTRP